MRLLVGWVLLLLVLGRSFSFGLFFVGADKLIGLVRVVFMLLQASVIFVVVVLVLQGGGGWLGLSVVSRHHSYVWVVALVGVGWRRLRVVRQCIWLVA